MKKLISLLLAAMLVLSLAACSNNTASDNQKDANQDDNSVSQQPSNEGDSETEEPTEVTITGLNGAGEEVEVTVPYNPQRVVVLDLANLDILDNLGLGDRIVGVPTITLEYLQSYAEDESITNVGSVKTPDLEAVMACEPDVIFMGGRMAEYYDDLSEIATVVRLISDTDLGLVESVRANAIAIGSIFGEGEQVDTLLAQYDARIEALMEAADGQTALLGMCTSGGFNLLGNDGRCSLIVNEIGFDNIGADAASTDSGSGRGGRGSSDGSDSGERSGGHGESAEGTESTGGRGSREESAEGTGGSTPTHGNEASFELVVSLDPDYIFVMDRDAAIGTNGAQLAKEIMENELVMKTDAYQNGNLVILEHPGIWYLAEGGITSLGIMLEDLESALL